QLGDGTNATRTAPVQVLTDVAFVATGPYHTLAVKTDQSVWAWGLNFYGQLGDGTTNDSATPVQVLGLSACSVAVGYDHSLAITCGGDVQAWGHNLSGQLGDGTWHDRWSPVAVKDPSGAPLSGVAQAAAGTGFSLALRTNGTVL